MIRLKRKAHVKRKSQPDKGLVAVSPISGTAPPIEYQSSPPVSASAPNIVPSPLNGQIAPVEHRFKPGQSGNPGGRPRILRDSAVTKLKKKTKNGETVADAVVDALIANAKLVGQPCSVSAFDKLRVLVEPTEEEAPAETDWKLLRMLYEISAEKRARGIEV